MMRFYCGPSLVDRTIDRWERDWHRVSRWHRWFAWRPVRTEKTRCAWLERLERRTPLDKYAYCTSRNWHLSKEWEYRPAASPGKREG